MTLEIFALGAVLWNSIALALLSSFEWFYPDRDFELPRVTLTITGISALILLVCALALKHLNV